MNGNQTETLRRSLKLWHVIVFGLAFMVPGAILPIYGIAVHNAQGMLPTAYIIALACMLFTAYSYGKMVKVYPVAGSAYAFTQKSISPHVGFLVGWSILMDYMLTPMINALIIGIFGNAFFPSIPIYVWVIAFVSIVTMINILGIKISIGTNAIFVLFQFVKVVLWIALIIKGLLAGKGTGSLLSTLPFYNPHVDFTLIFAAIPLLCYTFLGFDAMTTLSEETKDPKKTIPKGIFIVTIGIGLFYIIFTYLIHLIYPNYESFKNLDSAAVELAFFVGGNWFAAFVGATSFSATFMSSIASTASGSRVMYAMGRENVLPKRIFGYISPRFNTPIYNILIIGGVSFVALFINLLMATSVISFGALLAFTFVNLSVIGHYYIKKQTRTVKGTIFHLMIPLMGASTTIWLLTQLELHAVLLGASWIALGFVHLLYLTKFFRQAPPELLQESVNQ